MYESMYVQRFEVNIIVIFVIAAVDVMNTVGLC